MSSFEFKVVEDNLTDYLKKLEELMNDVSNTQNFLRDAGYEMHTDYVQPLMPEWNPNLINSPLEAEHQEFEHAGQVHSLSLLYTGFTRKAETEGLDLIFWEFAGDWSKESRHLRRDYAFFQETGYDEVVDPKEYQPSHTHFVQTGSELYQGRFEEKTAEYLEKLLNLERWERTSRPIEVHDYE